MANEGTKKHLNDFIAEHAPLINLHHNKLKNAGQIPQGIEADDLHMAGVHGLMDALHRYESKTAGREASFATYAGQRIRGKMLDHISSQSYVPRIFREEVKRVKKKD